MKIKKGFILKKMGKDHMVVPVGIGAKELNGIIQLNESGAFLWKEMKKDISEEELITKMCERYNGLDREQARTDLRDFVTKVNFAVEQ